MYDYLIVGAGLFGAVFAHEMKKAQKSCLVIEKRNHIGGNVYTEKQEGINVHKYGAHIFHTNDDRVWKYITGFAEFNRYTNSPVANFKGEIYNLPFNMNTFSKMWGVFTPDEAKKKIAGQRLMALARLAGVSDADAKAVAEGNASEETTRLVEEKINGFEPRNLEEQAISLVGTDIYEKLVNGYTEKQWGRPCTELPSFIIKRLPVRFVYDNNYFNAKYQGIPVGGYTKLVEKLFEGIEVKTGIDYFEELKSLKEKGKSDRLKVCAPCVEYDKNFLKTLCLAKKLVFTGPVDEYFGYSLGALQYRSVRFETETLDTDNFQGNAVVNYTDAGTPFTRIIEHKWFEFGKDEDGNDLPKTIISREYSREWSVGEEPYYPVNDSANSALYAEYKKLADGEENVVFGGRLGEYKYYDMDQVILSALKLAEQEMNAGRPAK